MIGLVVVSHSYALAKAAVGLASEMIPADSSLQIAIAAGLDDVTIGTDAAKIEEAITTVDSPDGVLVFLDLGSAVLSAELAVEFCEPDVAERVRLTSAPLVEGLVAAVVTAAAGGSLDEVETEALAGATAKAQHLGVDVPVAAPVDDVPDDAEWLTARFVAPKPHGLHARPAAALVAALRGLDATVRLVNMSSGGSASARSVTQVAALGALAGDSISVEAAGPNADEAVAALLGLAEKNFGDPLEEEQHPSPMDPGAATVTENSGTGMALGPVYRSAVMVNTAAYQHGDSTVELERSAAAHLQVMAYLSQFCDDPIFVAQSAMLDDPELVAAVDAVIRSGVSAPDAWKVECQTLATKFEGLATPYLRERAADVRSIERLILLALMDQPLAPTSPTEPSIIVIDELDAATAKAADTSLVLGFVTLTGGRTGHGVLVATSRGIPVVAGVPSAAQLDNGDVAAIDATQNTVTVNPDAEAIAQWEQLSDSRAKEHSAALENAFEPAFTESGTRVLVEANIASLSDAVTGKAYGAEGSGLVRTELLFEGRATAPTIQEQADVFVAIGEALGGTLTIRTWDVGGDKPLPFLPQAKEMNPFLGERGVRTMRRVPELFADQLAAIAEASKKVPVRILVPMVTNPDEVEWVRAQLAQVAQTYPHAADVPLGIMVEVPAAAVRAADFRELVDFVSVGTNDLTQYALAVDRGNAVVSDIAAGAHPVVFDLIAAAHEGLGDDIPIAVCGDLASDPTCTEKLIASGVTELSVQPLQVPLIKQAVRQTP